MFRKVGLLFFCLFVLVYPTSAQTVLTIAVPDYLTDTFNDALFADFEAANPGVDVVVVKQGDVFIPPVEMGLEKHLDGVAAYTTLADVVYISSFDLTLEATQAGYYLDLAPLVMTDADLNADDFYRPIWESFMWDDGVWALPVSAATQVVVYDPAAFDAVGLDYPDASWTIDDYANAIRALTKREEDGSVSQYAMLPYSVVPLFRSMLPSGLYDDTTLPNMPKIDSPELAAILDTWLELEREGLLQSPQDADTSLRTAYRSHPIEISTSQPLLYGQPDGRSVRGAPLPGNTAGLMVNGFGVSAGTVQPELAYALVKHMTTRSDVAFRMFADVAARRDLNINPGQYFSPLANAPQEIKDFIYDVTENALPTSEMRYTTYLSTAIGLMRRENFDAISALQQAQAKALDNVAFAQQRSLNNRFTVQTINLEPLPEGEIELQFAMYIGRNIPPNEHLWNDTLKVFAENDPLVGRVKLDVRPIPSDFSGADCFFTPFPQLGGTTLDLKPLVSADVNYDAEDFLPGVLSHEAVWGLPIVLYPDALLYDQAILEQYGLNTLNSIHDFDHALKVLHEATGSPAYLPPQRFGSTYLLGLMAAYGALPVDYSTIPPTVALNQPAVQQVLDLAKSGAIAYSQLHNGVGGGSVAEAPLMGDMFSPIGRYMTSHHQSDYRITVLPAGDVYTPVSYTVGAAYINTTAQNPEACYRLISTLAEQPVLFGGIPARRTDTSAQNPELSDFSAAFIRTLEAANAVSIPDVSQLGLHWQGNYFVQRWIDQAFDRYVLNDEEFSLVMDETQRKIEDFLNCTADIALDEIVFEPFRECAITVDPTMTD